ncbi:MAG: hypothetical protein A3D74_01425 [Candidatus Levybacteria bacterium RIFCSPHIGHO2_02_FULL_37_13]|nr:MAG: hypothetical protein A3D74_01425 [Candidatus Levybacteria bacterium RIFCSPHIGHO2_02_FULL_37_13]OGH29925.1 MAG: hypothetical protein A3E40_04240 [Candidatus Levybacteria bacterium RIFCSPHIGHO2_12_FULL_37_9]
MKSKIVRQELLFEVRDVFGRKIRTTKDYWLKIKTLKHQELRFGIIEVKKTLKIPDEVRRSVTDETVLLFSKKVTEYDILIVAVKVLNSDGFLVTVYQTKKYTKKGKLVWLRQQKE